MPSLILKDREKLWRDEGKAAHLVLVGGEGDSPPPSDIIYYMNGKREMSL